jgi:hypothetical protein
MGMEGVYILCRVLVCYSLLITVNHVHARILRPDWIHEVKGAKV